MEIDVTANNDSNNQSASNFTLDKYQFYGYPVVVPLAIIMILIIILAIGGNVMVIMTILRHRGMRTRTNMFIVNLALADILVAVMDMPVSLVTVIEGNWVFGEALCQLNGFTMALFLICSIHTLMYISIHKYISITRPFSRAMTPTRIKLMILASWLWAAFCATGPIIGWNHIVYKKGSSQCGPDIPKSIQSLTHSLLITTSNYIIPLGVMIFCYSRIFREIHVHMKRIRKTSNIDLENSVQQQKKVATTLFLVLACFLLCWTPFVMYSNALVLIKDKSKVPLIFNPLAYWCGYMNSACNPIIYAFRSPSFRKGYKEIMCGATSPGLSAVNSLSFRSRSARGSLKSTSNTITVKTTNSHQNMQRQRTLLAQTSWRSLPVMPSLIRSFSKKQSSERRGSDSSSIMSGCGLCGLWTPRTASYESGKVDDDPQHEENPDHQHEENPDLRNLNDIKEDDEVREGDDKIWQGYEEQVSKNGEESV